MSGFYFNGQAIEGHAGYLDGEESYDDDDDDDADDVEAQEEEEEDEEDEEYCEESSQGYGPRTSDDEDGYEVEVDEYGGGGGGGGSSRLGPLPQMGNAQGHRGQVSNNSEQTIEDLDKMLSRPPPKLSHFVSDDLPSLTEERRRLRLEQYQPPKPAQQRQRQQQRQRRQQQQQRSPQRDGFDTNLLNEAFAYVKKLTGTVNSKALMTGTRGNGGGGGGGSASANGSRRKKKKKKGQSAASQRPLAQGSALRAARAAGGRGRGKGQKGPRKLNTQYGRGQSRVNKAGKVPGKLGLKKTMNQRVKERLHDEAFKKSGAKGPSPDMQQLIEQFETGSTISALRDELRRSKESETTSAEFIATARRQWLQ